MSESRWSNSHTQCKTSWHTFSKQEALRKGSQVAQVSSTILRSICCHDAETPSSANKGFWFPLQPDNEHLSRDPPVWSGGRAARSRHYCPWAARAEIPASYIQQRSKHARSNASLPSCSRLCAVHSSAHWATSIVYKSFHVSWVVLPSWSQFKMLVNYPAFWFISLVQLTINP